MGIRSTIMRKLCAASIHSVSELVYHYVKHNPDKRLCDISKALMPHGQTSRLFTSHILKDLVAQGRIKRYNKLSIGKGKYILYGVTKPPFVDSLNSVVITDDTPVYQEGS